jgi:hypothetical protein
MRIILGEDGTTRGATKLAALKHNSNYFRDALREMGCEVLGDAGSPVVPLMIYHPQKLISFSDECMKRGVAVVVVGAPATPLLEGRARFCISASHTKKDIDFALNAIREVSDAVGVRLVALLCVCVGGGSCGVRRTACAVFTAGASTHIYLYPPPARASRRSATSDLASGRCSAGSHRQRCGDYPSGPSISMKAMPPQSRSTPRGGASRRNHRRCRVNAPVRLKLRATKRRARGR